MSGIMLQLDTARTDGKNGALLQIYLEGEWMNLLFVTLKRDIRLKISLTVEPVDIAARATNVSAPS